MKYPGLTKEQAERLAEKIKALATEPFISRTRCNKNDSLFCFINMLNALGFISAEEYKMLDEARAAAFVGGDATLAGAIVQSYADAERRQ